MEISFEYSRKRSEFGRPCNFSDFLAEVTVDIPPDPSLADNFIRQDLVDSAVQEGPLMALHEVNTERVEVSIRGVNHVEGGWPKHVDPKNSELTTRYREEVEREEVYTRSVQHLGSLVEHYIRQNNTIDIYEQYFEEEEEEEEEEEHPSAKTINVLRDPNLPRRMATHLCWHPDANRAVAVAYCSLDFQDSRKNLSFDSYIWDLVYWDTRKGGLPMEMTPVELSHRDPVYGACWLPSRTGTECLTGSTDGQVLWWDIRKLSQPSEKLILDITREDQLKKALGAISLDFAPTMPTKFLVGTEQGIIISCNRDAKTPPEKIANIFSSHIGAVYRVSRNPFFPKVFLSVGDWTARIWTEELMDSSSIMETKYHTAYLLDVCWSQVKPAVFFTARSDGTLDVWDFLYHQKEPSLSLKVSIDPLLSLCSQDNGQIVACGTRQGTVYLLEMSPGLCTMRKNEKTLTSTPPSPRRCSSGRRGGRRSCRKNIGSGSCGSRSGCRPSQRRRRIHGRCSSRPKQISSPTSRQSREGGAWMSPERIKRARQLHSWKTRKRRRRMPRSVCSSCTFLSPPCQSCCRDEATVPKAGSSPGLSALLGWQVGVPAQPLTPLASCSLAFAS
ncbi:dynein axonemal intermediate chain 2 isoform X3 [Prinia subflava]|uniref:dynein axonemal intermediate chain 2 isoform X3 n=1 Tax=Prinia subflava TaxID=208062 RepID=UPI002FE09BE0